MVSLVGKELRAICEAMCFAFRWNPSPSTRPEATGGHTSTACATLRISSCDFHAFAVAVCYRCRSNPHSRAALTTSDADSTILLLCGAFNSRWPTRYEAQLIKSSLLECSSLTSHLRTASGDSLCQLVCVDTLANRCVGQGFSPAYQI